MATSSACSRQDKKLREVSDQLTSLRATTTALGAAWLAGDISGTYTSTALDQTFALIDRQRMSLDASPRAVVDPRGARLSQAGERLSRLVAVLQEDVHRSDADSARRHLAEVS